MSEQPWSSDPGNRQRRNVLATPIGAGVLAVLVVALAAAIAILPGLEAGPSSTPAVTCGAGSTSSPCAPPSSTAEPASTESPLPSFVRPTPTPGPTLTSYVVQSGDTLTSIARTFGTSPRSLAWWNRGTYPSLDPESEGYDPSHIEPGWTFVLTPGVIVDDSAAPTASPGWPTIAPTIGPSGSPGSTATASGPAIVVTNGPRGSGRIALTFDMGGRLDPAVDIVQWLIDHDVHATLFPTGKTGTTTDQGRAALLLAGTRPDLFAFGNHSWDHPDFTTLTAAQMADQLSSTEGAIGGLIGISTKPYFRPPYGSWTAAVRAGVGAAGWADLVMWDVDTIDWKATADGGPTADAIVTKVLTNAKGGSIVLMHLGGWHTLEALPDMLAGLKSGGLVPVTLPTMFGR